jgi:DNA-binding GntR family transcriptional regulator
MASGETTANRVAQIIAARVLDGSYAPGASLREVALAGELGVSRSSIREALRILERDGVVRIEAHRGASVTRLTPDELIEIYQVRAVLLGLAMGLCARRRSDRDLQTLANLHARMEQALDDSHTAAAGQHARLSAEMALLIIASAGNRRLEELLTQMANQIARYTRLGLSTRRRCQQSAATWKKVLDALAGQDSAAAERLGKQLVTETLRHALERIAALEPGPVE